ncbi:MAG: hypothetical protein E7272_11220 [Pseudobutyrivibrio ruminis]|uniref:Transposase (putative) YhgA-like domain-containing protein n=1 Tax=Pseudobutyrivibrio ruminis TaxID=46206 RepID=A0A927U8N5_9FIRM|nr:hypothetical protein [Pseudobutyrivibrio ruminis]
MSEKINMQYKDRLFRLLFGSEALKDNILSLYNALNCTNYKNPAEIELYTIDDVIYIKMKNDVAIILDSYLSLWEQQSSYNPNMPIRGLMYFGKLYDKYIETNELNIYGSKLIKIPTPRYIVFYNGSKDTKPVTELRLSEAFINPDKTNKFEWTAIMYNLNKGKNDDLLKRCKPLADYMTLINYIREYQINHELSVAVDKAIDQCIEEDVLKEFLVSHRSEVRDMCITEYNEKAFVNGIRADERTELVEGMIKENLPLEQIARIAKITIEEVEQIKQSLLATV